VFGRASPGVTAESLLRDIDSLGVARGDLVMVHASLRKIGLGRAAFGDGGAETLLDALDAAVGPEGTLLMVLGCETAQDEANRRPEKDRAEILAAAEPFDPREAAVLPEVGLLAEAFRLRAGTVVTDNPGGRFGARGRLAAALLEDSPWDDYYGPRSPLDRLCRGGKVLRMGADPETVTALHFAEYLADLPGKRRVRRHYRVTSVEGPALVAVECLDDEFGIVDWPGEDYFGLIVRDYLAGGRARTGRVGNASSELIDAADMVRFGVGWMETNLMAPAQPDP
jgi:aminoglycoside N3'-acetyltransferase